MIPSPTQEIQKKRSRSLAIQVEATPISATESTSPNASSQKWSRAIPATANTLSSDIETSARTIRVSASVGVVRWAASRAPEHSTPPNSGGLLVCVSRISRYIFHETHSSSTPPAKVKPITASSCTAK